MDKLTDLAAKLRSYNKRSGWIHLDAPKTSTSFDGDSFSDTEATLIDLSAEFGLPDNIKAVYLYVLARDSDSVNTECSVGFAPDTTNVLTKRIGTQPDVYDTFTPTVTCNADGDIYYQVNASGAGTLDLIIRVFGYLPASANDEGIVATISSTDNSAIHDNVSGEFAAITEKVTPVDGDLLIIEDSADSNNKKKVQIGNLPAGGASHDAVTVSDTATVDLTLTGQALSAAVLPAGIKLDDFAAPDDNTDLDASAAKHGLMQKYPGGTTNFLRADGTFAAPAGGGGTIVREAIFTKPGELYVGVGVTRYYNLTGGDLTISKVHLAVDTPNTGIALIVDTNIDGTTIFTTQANRPQVAAGANTGFSTTMDVTSWPNGSYITMDLDQVGSTYPGANFTGTIVC